MPGPDRPGVTAAGAPGRAPLLAGGAAMAGRWAWTCQAARGAPARGSEQARTRVGGAAGGRGGSVSAAASDGPLSAAGGRFRAVCSSCAGSLTRQFMHNRRAVVYTSSLVPGPSAA